MKTRKTKRGNMKRRIIAFLLCMTMVLGLGMQDVMEQVYAEDAAVQTLGESAPEEAPAEEKEVPEENAEPAETPAEENVTEGTTETPSETPSVPSEPAGDADADTGTEEGTNEQSSTSAEPTAPADDTQNGSGSETSDKTGAEGKTDSETQASPEDGTAVTNPDETAGEEAKDEKPAGDTDEAAEETTEPEEDQEPAEEEAQPYEKEETVGNVTIHVYAEAGVLPEDAELSVTPIEKKEITEDMSEEEKAEAEEINAQYEETEQKLKEDVEPETEAAMDDAAVNAVNTISAENAETDETAGKTLEGFLAYDISFLVKDENGEKVEIEPEGEVKISFEFDEAVIPEGVSEDAEVAVKHLKEDENAEGGIVVEDVTENAEVTINESAAVEAMSLTTDSFSTFVITWTVGPRYAETNFKVSFHYVYVDGNDVTEIPKDEYTPESGLKLEENQTYDLFQYAPKTIEGNENSYYSFTNTIRVNDGIAGAEIKKLQTAKDEGWLSTTYKVNYVTAQNEEKVWLSSEWGGKTEGHIYFIYEKSDALLFIKDNIMEEGTLQAIYTGEGTVTSYTWSKCSEESGAYTDVEKINYEGGASNLSENSSALYPAYDEGARQWYKVKVTLENGQTIESAAFQVPYYDELQNGSFEIPEVPGESSNMQYGNQEYLSAGGVWQSTGEVYNDYYDKDVALEIVHEGRQGGDTAYSWYGDWNNATDDGTQFAELNCQAAGALYQDVLTMEGTPLYYWLSHRARGNEMTNNPEYDTMYLVIMPTSVAVDNNLTTQDGLENYLQELGSTIGQQFSQVGQNVERNEENTSDGIRIVRITSNDQEWQKNIFGSYIPTSSLTRFFFVAGRTDADGNSNTPTQGNFLDNVGFSQDLPEVQDDQFTIRIQKNFEGLDAQHIDKVRESIQFKLSAIDNNTKQTLTDDELVNLFGKAYITGKDMTYANGSISWVLPNRSIKPNASYTVTVEEVGADVDGYVMNTSVKTSVTVGDGEPVESSAAEIKNLQGKTMAQITFTNTYDRSDNKTVNFTKVWDDGDDQFGTRPGSLEVTLKATVSINGTTRELTGEELGGVELTQTLNAPDWSTSWEVPVYYYPEDGSEKIAIDYTVEEGENTSDYEYEASEIVEGDPDKYVERFDANSITEEADVSTQNGINSISNSAVAAAPVQDQNDDFGAPSHHKYITYDAKTGEYTLNLDVTGKKGEAPGVDVLFVIDRSGSMGERPYIGAGGTYYNLLPDVKDVLTKDGGVIDQILGTEGNNNRVAYISFSDKNGTSSSSWYDADSSWDGYGTPNSPSLKQRIKNLTANGGTNWTYAMMKANELLAGRGNTENDVVVIFMSDGAPTYTIKNSYGHYWEDGWGNTTESSYREDAVEVVNSSSALRNAQFYSVYLHKNVFSGMKSFDDDLYIPQHALVNGTNLQSGLDEILNQVIPEYKNVTITDVLSEYAVFAEDPQIKVTKTVGDYTIELQENEYNLAQGDNRVEVTLLNNGPLEDGATYTVSFKVKPSEKANDEYATNGYNAEGDPGTGPTSAGKKGFYSNNSGLTKVSYQIEGEKEIKSASYERPVVQVTTHTLSYEKRWNHPDNVDTPNQDVTLKVTYTNGEEREIILKASEGWKYTETVSQNVKIDSIKEVSLNPDYKPDYFISSDGTKATVTNNYYKAAVDSFTVIKEWNDEGYEDQRPESVTVALYQSANGGESSQYGDAVELTNDNSWKHTWNTLPQTSDDGTESFTYEVREVNSPEHYISSIGDAEWSEDGKKVTVTITNTYDENCADESYYIANVLQTDQVTLIKTWNDDSNNQGIRPNYLNITLENGKDKKVYQLNSDDVSEDASNVWIKTVTVVARKNAQYSAVENLADDNYQQTESESGSSADGNYWFSFTNAVQTKTITVKKVWNDGGDVQGRPETITLELQYKVGNAWVRFTDITLSQDKDWTATVDGLLITNEYQVVEKDVPAGYISTSEVSEDGATYTVTNTLKWSLSKANMPEGGETEKYLAGAEFSLTDNRTEKIIATGVSGENGLITWTPQDGMTKAALNALDGEYTVTETKAPSGYQKLQGVWTLAFDKGVLTKAEASKGYESYISGITKDAETGATVVLKNSELYELPSTGGPGIHLYMLGGVALMMAGTLLVYKKRKEEVLRS